MKSPKLPAMSQAVVHYLSEIPVAVAEVQSSSALHYITCTVNLSIQNEDLRQLWHPITDDRPLGNFNARSSPDAGPAMAGNHGSVIIVICLLTCRNRLPSPVLGGAGKIANTNKKIDCSIHVRTYPTTGPYRRWITRLMTARPADYCGLHISSFLHGGGPGIRLTSEIFES